MNERLIQKGITIKMKHTFYTAGELAKLTGVSYKTIRHYYEKGLLEPENHTDSGYRLYGTKSVETLQRIIMLKYLNFSLEEIKKILEKEDTKETFRKQEKLLQAQMQHLEQVLCAVREMQKVTEEERWDQMIKIMRITQQKEEIIKQYMESDNLQKRINIHAYSTSKIDWFRWVFDGLQLKEGMKILEVGCGNGALWIAMGKQLPPNLQIILTDSSADMLQSAKDGLAQHDKLFREKNIQFIFLQRDAENFYIEESGFDRVIANHMLYHVSNANRPKLLQTCWSLLKDDGMFYASTIGNTHMRELYTLMKELDSRIEPPGWMSANFELENGEEQLKKVFPTVYMEEHENDLLVPNPQAIFDYIESLPGNIKEILQERKDACMIYLKSKVSEDTPYFIHKSTGAFRAFKK